jgi:hypothetical protein
MENKNKNDIDMEKLLKHSHNIINEFDRHKEDYSSQLVFAAVIRLVVETMKSEEHKRELSTKLKKQQDTLYRRQISVVIIAVVTFILVAIAGGVYINKIVRELRFEFKERKRYADKKECVKVTMELFKQMQDFDIMACKDDSIFRNLRYNNFPKINVDGKMTVEQSENIYDELSINIYLNRFFNYFEVWKMYDLSGQIDSASAANMLPYFEFQPKTEKIIDTYLKIMRQKFHLEQCGCNQNEKSKCVCNEIFDGYHIIFNKYLNKPIPKYVFINEQF